MFYLNVHAWKHLPFIQKQYATDIIDQIEQDLQDLAETSTSAGEIEWGMRQIAYEQLYHKDFCKFV